MKITIAPTHDQTLESHPQHAVTIETPHDDTSLDEALEIIHAALVAWGFGTEAITQKMNEFES
jgi:hypothetical protein